MIKCSCGKPIEKLPNWLEGVKVDFVCNNCPNRQTKNIAFVQLEVEPKAKIADELEEELPADEDLD
jgi:hypothetical protein